MKERDVLNKYTVRRLDMPRSPDETGRAAFSAILHDEGGRRSTQTSPAPASDAIANEMPFFGIISGVPMLVSSSMSVRVDY